MGVWQMKAFRKLVWAHWFHAALLLQMLVTGSILYFPNLRTEFVEYKMIIFYWHLVISFIYVALLCLSLPFVLSYLKQLSRNTLKKLHITLVYLASLAWTFSGVIMWRIHDFPVSWRESAITVHDDMTIILIPWVFIHVGWVLVGRRFYAKKIRRKIPTNPGFHLSRREFLVGLVGVLGSVLLGGITKWYSPMMGPLQLGQSKPKGDFRIYNVSSEIPKMNSADYQLRVDGLVNEPTTYDLDRLKAFPQVSITRDFHCVTGWTVSNVVWGGIPLSYLLQQVKLLPTAKYMTVYSFDGLYTDSYTLKQLSKVDVLIALQMDGVDLPVVHGAPCRIIFPDLYGYKSVKWVKRIEFTAERSTGFWEQRGYDLNGTLPT